MLFYSILIKVKQYEEFFPPFQTLMMDMFQILGKFDTAAPPFPTIQVIVSFLNILEDVFFKR